MQIASVGKGLLPFPKLDKNYSKSFGSVGSAAPFLDALTLFTIALLAASKRCSCQGLVV